ncbi:hypothetical protein NHH03_12975 [Stieleria sp. TO1_6]|uniref:hypothetical protein n=1 Tax=Stieleria tagensis TaxID=2956795 RepID=UPI00209B9695|nr:hypothetical protein [Stieleria tagensis]MCO8122653.1 hypothetical protein [Stieleria tagensis]
MSTVEANQPTSNEGTPDRNTRTEPSDHSGSVHFESIEPDGPPLSLEKLAWFHQAIESQNCALFEASLYPIKRHLRRAVQHWLCHNHPQHPVLSDSVQLSGLVDELIIVAFEHSSDWHSENPVCENSVIDRIMSHTHEAFQRFEYIDWENH